MSYTFNVFTGNLDCIGGGSGGSGIPSGTVVDYAGSVQPSGWLFCAGQAVSRATFAPLFTVLGETFGPGDGSTTFNLPDLRGRTSFAPDAMGGVPSNRLVANATIDTTNADVNVVCADITGLAIGMTVTASGVQAGSKIAELFTGGFNMDTPATSTASGVSASCSLSGTAELGQNGGSSTHVLNGAELPPSSCGIFLSDTVNVPGTSSIQGASEGAGDPNGTTSSLSGAISANMAIMPPHLILNKIIKT